MLRVFGLLGHLSEVCEGSGLSAEIHFDAVPKFGFLEKYIHQKSMPGGTQRNWDSYGARISGVDDYRRAILADPQTSGGLLVAVDPGKAEKFRQELIQAGLDLQPFGEMIEKRSVSITVR